MRVPTNWRNVVELGLARIRLTEVPPELCNLKTLRKLDLSNNSISLLPDALCKLRFFELFVTTDDKLFDTEGVSHGYARVWFPGAKREMCVTSQSIFFFRMLEEFNVAKNKLTSFPKDVGDWQNLAKLGEKRSSYNELPCCVGRLLQKRLTMTKNRPKMLVSKGKTQRAVSALIKQIHRVFSCSDNENVTRVCFCQTPVTTRWRRCTRASLSAAR